MVDFSNVTTVDEFSQLIQDNKKTFWGERLGNCTFRGAGKKAILLETDNGKEFVSYAQAYDGKGRYGKLLNRFFFGGEDEDSLSVTDILNLIDENLSDEDIALLVKSLKIDSPVKVDIEDVFRSPITSECTDIQDHFDKVERETKLPKADESQRLSVLMGLAICDYYNNCGFDYGGFEPKADNVVVTRMSKDDNHYMRRLAEYDYYLFRTANVDAFARVDESKEGGYVLSIKLLW